MIRHAHRALLTVALLGLGTALPAQDGNIMLPISAIEAHLRADSFELVDMRGSRFETDRTQRVLLRFNDSTLLLVKWAKAAPGAATFNNEPRYELAAYALQKLFLDEPDYVVPPTIVRPIPLDFYRTLRSDVSATFDNTASVLVVLQYWLAQVTGQDVHDPKRFERDQRYAYHLANTNLFSYLVRHSDSNFGNFLVSTDATNPRVFAVDNGVAFSSIESDRGKDWRQLRVKRFPARSIERLRRITTEDLQNALGVVAQFEIRGTELVAVAPTENLDPRRGVRKADNLVQLGLTAHEIDAVASRIRWLLKKVDDGSLETF
ncbi:MAG: hypothetical protein ACT443_07945 [Gemmatimonadota bacterium]